MNGMRRLRPPARWWSGDLAERPGGSEDRRNRELGRGEGTRGFRGRGRMGFRAMWAKHLIDDLEGLRDRLDTRIKALEKYYRSVQGSESHSSAGDDYSTDTGDDYERPATTRVLFMIFDELEDDDFTDDLYPIVSNVNKRLEEEGYARLHQDAIRKAYDKWLHSERNEAPDKTGGSSGKVTSKVLFSVFEKIEGHKDHFTEDDYPKVSSVNEILEKRNHGPATQREIRQAYKSWSEEQKE